MSGFSGIETNNKLDKLKLELEREMLKIVYDSYKNGYDEGALKNAPRAMENLPVAPVPCVKDTGCVTVKDFLQKINEELDELKEAVTWWTCSADFKVEDTVEEIKNDVQGSRDTLDDYICGSRWHIAEEAADVCTAVTSLCEALTIDEHMRNAAQQKVNAHNKERGRW